MRIVTVAVLASILAIGCNEDSEEGPLACARATEGDACSFREPCTEVVDRVEGRCGTITTSCEGGRVVMRDETTACSDDGGVADATP